MIGTNDLAAGRSVEYIISNYKLILRRIREASPETEVYIQGVLPTEVAIHTTRKNRDIMQINKELQDIAGEQGLVYIQPATFLPIIPWPIHSLRKTECCWSPIT